VVNIKAREKPKDKDEKVKKITKLAIGMEGGANVDNIEWEYTT